MTKRKPKKLTIDTATRGRRGEATEVEASAVRGPARPIRTKHISLGPAYEERIRRKIHELEQCLNRRVTIADFSRYAFDRVFDVPAATIAEEMGP